MTGFSSVVKVGKRLFSCRSEEEDDFSHAVVGGVDQPFGAIAQNQITPPSQLKPLTADEITSYFKKNLFSDSYFNSKKIPALFLKFSKDRQANELEKIKDEIEYLMHVYDHLLKDDIQRELSIKGKNDLQKYFRAIYVMGEYISTLYKIEFKEGTITAFEKRTLTVKDLLDCFEATKKLKDVQEGRTLVSADVEVGRKKEDVFLSLDKQVDIEKGLPQGGVEQKTTFQRLFSRESLGIAAYAIGSEATSVGAYTSTGFNALGLVESNLLMMTGFALMTSSDSGIGCKFALQQMLLGDVCYSLTKAEVNKLSYATWLEIKELLPETYDLTKLNFKKNTKGAWVLPNPPTQRVAELTSADAAKFFDELLNSTDEFTYQKLKTKFIERVRENKSHGANLSHFLKTQVTKRDGIWGTALDHFFAKLNDDDKKLFVAELKNEPFRLNNDNKIPSELLGENGAINYIHREIKSTNWADRIVGTQKFSVMIFNIYACQLKPDEKLFLIKMIVDELAAGDRGEFAAGKIKRANIYRNGAVAGLYTATSICAYVVGFFATPLATALIKYLTNAAGASAFGWLGAQPHLGESAAHESKIDLVNEAEKVMSLCKKDTEKDKAISSHTNETSFGIKEVLSPSRAPTKSSTPSPMSGIGTKNGRQILPESSDISSILTPVPPPFENKYNNFLERLKEFKKLKDKKVNEKSNDLRIRLIQKIKDLATGFEKEGVAKFVFESNHGEKNSPLLEIIEAILDNNKLKQIANLKKPTEREAEFKNLKSNAVEDVKGLLKIIYKSENENIKSVDAFNIFISEGYRKAKTSKDKFMFSLQCSASLSKIKDEQPGICKDCELIFFKAVKNAASDKSSLLYDLQKRNAKTYAKRRTLFRVASNLMTMGLIGVIIALTAFPLTSVLGFVGAAFFMAFWCAADFAGRKLGERFEYSTRTTIRSREFKGFEIIKSRELGKAYRHYEAIRSLVGEYEDAALSPKISAKQALENVKSYSLTGHYRTDQNEIIKELGRCLTWETAVDDEKITSINDSNTLKEEVNKILKQGFDKNSVQTSLARAQRLILMGDEAKISKNEKRILLCELALQGCICGQFADILQTRAMWGSDRYLLADAGLGFLAGSIGFFMGIPGLLSSADGSQNLTQWATQFSLQVGLDIPAVYGWVQAIDVSREGRTESFKRCTAAFKKTLSIFTPKLINEERKEREAQLFNNVVQKNELKERYKIGTQATKMILGVKRTQNPFVKKPSTLKEFEEKENALAAA